MPKNAALLWQSPFKHAFATECGAPHARIHQPQHDQAEKRHIERRPALHCCQQRTAESMPRRDADCHHKQHEHSKDKQYARCDIWEHRTTLQRLEAFMAHIAEQQQRQYQRRQRQCSVSAEQWNNWDDAQEYRPNRVVLPNFRNRTTADAM